MPGPGYIHGLAGYSIVNFMRKITGIGLLVFILFSCQQEPDEIIADLRSRCNITTGLYYGGSGGINDSSTFTYLDNKLAKVEGRDNFILFNYTGTHISSRKFIEKLDNSVSRLDTVQYDLNGRPVKYINWYLQDSFFPDTTRVIYTYEYGSGKLQSVTEATTLFSAWGIMEDTVINTFSWDAAGNISKINYAGPDHIAFDSISYNYNNHPNYFSAVYPDFYLFEPYFELHVGLIAHLPYFYSRNNVTGFRISGIDYQVQYGLDSLNKVTSINLDNFEYMKYRYHCN
jgi:hypothetical protein